MKVIFKVVLILMVVLVCNCSIEYYMPEYLNFINIPHIKNHCDYVIENKTDLESWGKEEEWQRPETTENLKSGDCEDKSILFMNYADQYFDEQYLFVALETTMGGHAIAVSPSTGDIYDPYVSQFIEYEIINVLFALTLEEVLYKATYFKSNNIEKITEIIIKN